MRYKVNVMKSRNYVEIISDLFTAYRTGCSVVVRYKKGIKIPMRFNSAIYKLLHKLHNTSCVDVEYFVSYILHDTETNAYKMGSLIRSDNIQDELIGDTSTLKNACDWASNYVNSPYYSVRCSGSVVRNVFFVKDVAVILASNHMTYFAETVKELDKLLFISFSPVKISLLG